MQCPLCRELTPQCAYCFKIFNTVIKKESYAKLHWGEERELLTHTFYQNLLAKETLVLRIWSIGPTLAQILHERFFYFSIYEGGRLIDPKRDPRFYPAFVKFRASPLLQGPWVDCCFDSLGDLILFIDACHF